MNRSSQKALSLGEELFDYVDYGLTRNDAVQELAEMVDETNHDLLEAIATVLQEARRNGGVPSAFSVAELDRVVVDYQPKSGPPDTQGELPGVGASAQPRLL